MTFIAVDIRPLRVGISYLDFFVVTNEDWFICGFSQGPTVNRSVPLFVNREERPLVSLRFGLSDIVQIDIRESIKAGVRLR